jgi:mRNA interferase MazF
MPPEPTRRWDLLLVDLETGPGSEQRGVRPALVISNDGFNRHFPLMTVLPLTKRGAKHRRAYAFEVIIPANAAGNEIESIVMPHQIRTVSSDRVVRRLGQLRARDLRAEIEDRLADHLGMGFEEEDDA